MNLLSIILPIYILIFLGYWLRRTEKVSFEGVKTLKLLLLNIALPCLLFHGVATTNMSDLDVAQPYLLYYGVLISLFGLVFVLAKKVLKLKTDEASVMSLASVFSNNIYIGIPLILQLFGKSAMPMYFALLLFHSFITIVPCYTLLEVSRSDKHILKSIGKVCFRMILSPVILSLVLALVFLQLQWTLPIFVDLTLKNLSALAMPIALILLGTEFNGFRLRGNVVHALIIALINNVVLPVCVFVIGKFIMGLEWQVLQLILVLTLVPMGLMPYLTAMHYNVYVRRTMSGFMLSNALAPFTMLGLFWLFGVSGTVS